MLVGFIFKQNAIQICPHAFKYLIQKQISGCINVLFHITETEHLL